MSHLRSLAGKISTLVLIVTLSGCLFPEVTASGKQAVLDQVRRELTRGNCDAAISYIDPIYNSTNSDNTVRMLRAAAYGCKAGVFFASMITFLSTLNFASNSLWSDLTEEFMSVYGTDTKMETALVGMESLLTVVTPGYVLSDQNYSVNLTSPNPATATYQYRTDDSNLMMILMGFAVMGSVQARYGDPDGTFAKQQNLPWISHDMMTEIGCEYAASMANIVDGALAVEPKVSPSLATIFSSISSNFGAVIDVSCDFGCQGLSWDGLNPVDQVDCAYAVGECATCPMEMREKTLCMASQKARCAAAGIVRFVNDSPLGWN